LKKNIELKSKEFFNERALAVTLDFSMLSLQILNLVAIEKLLNWEDEEMLSDMVETFLKYNHNIFSLFRNVEKVYYKYSGSNPGYLREYSTLARKYYHVLNLFFWWACGTGSANCNRILTSKVFHEYSNKLRKLNLAS
jgi:hypothetical protein